MEELIECLWATGDVDSLPVLVTTNPIGKEPEIVVAFGDEYLLEQAKQLAEHIVEAHNLWYQQTQMR